MSTPVDPRTNYVSTCSAFISSENLNNFTKEEVSSIPLDKILEKLSGKILLKIDCEGSEFCVLSASRLLNKVDRIIAEFHFNKTDKVNKGLWKYDLSEDGIVKFLKERGFIVEVYRRGIVQDKFVNEVIVAYRDAKIALVCLAHNRPYYAKFSVESILKARKPKRMKTFVYVDTPDETKEELINIYKSLGDIELRFSNIGFGAKAYLLAFREIFSEGFDLCFLVLEDVIISADFFEFCLDVLQEVSSKLAAVCCYSMYGKEDDTLFYLQGHFSDCGACLLRSFFLRNIEHLVDEFLRTKTKEEYRDFVEKYKLDEAKHLSGFGPDVLLYVVIRKRGLLTALPFKSRSRHIGTSGFHLKGPAIFYKTLEEYAFSKDPAFYSAAAFHTQFYHRLELNRERQSLKLAKCVLVDYPFRFTDGLTYYALRRYTEFNDEDFFSTVHKKNYFEEFKIDKKLKIYNLEYIHTHYKLDPLATPKKHIETNAKVKVQDLIAETPHLKEKDKEFLRETGRKVDFCIAPTNFIKDVVNKYFNNVLVIPISIDFNSLTEEEPLEIDFGNRFVFLCISTMQRRKNIPELIECFEKAFEGRDDVCLVLKIGFGGLKDVNSLLKYKKYKRPLIFFSTKTLNRKQLNWLYRKAHAYVTATRGEGLNIPLLEAMYVGLPVIAPLHTAHLDYLTEENSFPVRSYGMRLLEDNSACYNTHIGYEFPIVDLDDMIAKMRYVVDNYNKAKAKTSLARETVLKKFSVEVTREQLLNVLREYS